MNIVGARLRIHDDLRSATPAVLSRIGVRQDFELLNVVENRSQCETVYRRVVVIDAVQQIIVGSFPRTRSIETAVKGERRSGSRRKGTWNQLR